MTKILLVTRSYDEKLGGMETHTKAVVEYLKGSGYKVTVLTTKLSDNPSFVLNNVLLIRLKSRSNDLLKYTPAFLYSVRRFIKDNGGDYDCIINISIAGSLISPKSLRQLPMLTVSHGTYRREITSFLSIIKNDPKTVKAYLGIAASLVFHFLQKRTSKISGKIIAVSGGVENSLKKYYAPDNKVVLIRNFTNLRNFKFKKRNYDNGDLKFLFISRIHKQKGIGVLIESIQNLYKNGTPISCTIAGDGPELNVTRNLLPSDKFKNVNILGRVPHEQVPELMQRHDVLLFPTIAQEGIPLTVVEAMSSGLVCIISDISGPNELITNGQNGLFCEPGSVPSLVKQVNHCLKMDVKDFRELGIKASADVRSNYSLDNLKILGKTIDELVAAKRKKM